MLIAEADFGLFRQIVSQICDNRVYKLFTFFFQSLALLETELPVKIAVLNVLQRFSRNSGKFHLTAKEVDKFMVFPDAEN